MTTRDGNYEVYSMSAAGEHVTNLTNHQSSDYAFSATQGRLIFHSDRSGNDEIYLREANGKAINLTNHASGDRLGNASPDGKRLVFNSDRDHEAPELYVMNIDGSSVKRLTNNANYEDAASWSPDGKRIIFSRDIKPETETDPGIPSNGEIFVMDADGKNEKRLTDRPGFDGGPQFSPDGKKIAFYGRGDGNFLDLFLMNADGSGLENLTQDELEDYSPSWSPDGKWIAYTSGNSSNYDVWIIEVATKKKTRLTTDPKRDESPFWLVK